MTPIGETARNAARRVASAARCAARIAKSPGNPARADRKDGNGLIADVKAEDRRGAGDRVRAVHTVLAHTAAQGSWAPATDLRSPGAIRDTSDLIAPVGIWVVAGTPSGSAEGKTLNSSVTAITAGMVIAGLMAVGQVAAKVADVQHAVGSAIVTMVEGTITVGIAVGITAAARVGVSRDIRCEAITNSDTADLRSTASPGTRRPVADSVIITSAAAGLSPLIVAVNGPGTGGVAGAGVKWPEWPRGTPRRGSTPCSPRPTPIKTAS